MTHASAAAPSAAHARKASRLHCHADERRTIIERKIAHAAEEMQLEVGALLAFVEFMDEHGDRHVTGLSGAARLLLRRLATYAEQFEGLARELADLPRDANVG